MQVAELWPCDRHHLHCGVKLHGAGAKRDHRTVERQVAIRKTSHVAHHLGFGPVHVEDRMGQIVGGPQQVVGDRRQVRGRRQRDAKGLADGDEMSLGRDLVERYADPVGAHVPQVDAPRHGGRHDAGLLVAHFHGHRVEKRLVLRRVTTSGQRCGQPRGAQVHPLGDRAQTLGAVENGVKACHDSQQGLGGANVGGRLLASDMLLAGLQGQAVGLLAVAVDADPDDAPRQRALERIAAGHEGGMRPAVAKRHAKALRRADGDVRAHGARLFQQRQRQQIGGHDSDGLVLVQSRDQVGGIRESAEGAGVLEQGAKDLLGLHAVTSRDLNLDPQRLGPGLDDRDGLGMTVLVHEEHA
mmetsp:Transcript_1234/g.2447  ORF Transcript_1234/g.2447 Transcript_1234/m.2447 type:complete len:355 (+) Transcript_1234:1912-2976(+)